MAAAGLFISLTPVYSQDDDTEEIFELSPFEVSADDNQGYRATSTLAGTRLRTELKDVGSAIQAVTEEFMNDIGATDATTLLQYTTNTEVSGPGGNFAGTGLAATPNEDGRMRNPDSSTRVRGLQEADNARDFYKSILPWDGYNVERVDIQRGANSILFGLGSPAGIVNADIIDASLGSNSKEIGLRTDQHGSLRVTFDMNQVILDDQLAIRVAALNDNEKYQQKPAFEDDKRIFVAARYEPNFLRTDSARTVLRAKYEDGQIERNSPRILPPVDRITPWFNTQGDDALNGEGLDPRTADDNNSRLPGHGIAHRNYDDNATPNPYWNPWIGDMSQIYGGLVYVFDNPNSGNIQSIYDSTASVSGGLASDGSVDNGIDGIGNRRLRGIRRFSSYADEVGLPGADKGLYKDYHITDASIFDFYNNLIEGPNKGVEADFDAINLVLEQTFFDNRLGFEVAHDKQTYNDEQLTLINDWRFSLAVDINEKLPTGEVNPNYGRPFVSDSPWTGGKSGTKVSETNRASAYYDLDFNEVFESEFLGKLLGKHTFNVAHTEYEYQRTDTAFQRYVTDSSYGDVIGKNDHRDNNRHSNWVSYLGPSLAGRSNASGANISPIGDLQQIVSGGALSFDTTWNAQGVDPGAAWTDPFNGNVLTQSENPANYVGWSPLPINILDASNMADREKMYRSFDISEASVTSDVAVWQGRFWDGAILPMLAVREDSAATNVLNVAGRPYEYDSEGNITEGTGPDGTIANIDSLVTSPDTSLVDEDNPVSKGLVVHVDKLIGSDKLPVELSLFYNESSNFNPGERRVDVFGNAISPPSGETEDYGFLVSSKSGRFSARVTWYETAINEASNGVLESNLWQLGVVENWALNNAFIQRDMPQDTGRASWEFMTQQDGETDDAFLQRRIDTTQVVFDNALSRDFHEAWGIKNIYKSDGTVAQFDGDGGVDLSTFYNRLETAKSPSGVTATSDTVSKGMEIEIHAQPTDNWTIAFNAAQTEAFFYNVGGALAEYVETRGASYQNVVNGIRFGDVNVWGGGTGGSNTVEARDAGLFGSLELLKLQEGSATPELREWRANLVTKYNFTDGKFAGVNVGLGYRWQGENALGYGLNGAGEFDLANPYMGPSESNVDMWIGYGRELGEHIDWYIQLNVSNAFQDDNLIPVTVQPDGSVAGVRIGPRQSWFLQNTFKF